MSTCVASWFITIRVDKQVSLQPSHPFAINMDIALSREVNRQGQSSSTIRVSDSCYMGF